MTFRELGHALAGLALIAAAPIRAETKAAAAVYEPTGSWKMEWATNACYLGRIFSNGKDDLLVRFGRYEPARAVELMVAGHVFENAKFISSNLVQSAGNRSKINVEIAYGTSPFHMPVSAKMADSNAGPALILSDSFPAGNKFGQVGIADAETAARIENIQFKISNRTVDLRTGSMGPPMQALSDCTVDLLKSWGFDPAVQTSLTKKVTVHNSGPFLQALVKEYPPGDATKTVMLRFLINVDEKGAFTGCRLLQGYTEGGAAMEAFAKAACKNVPQFLKFDPALDKVGQPVASYYIGNISWYP